jgi:hypothetical protein
MNLTFNRTAFADATALYAKPTAAVAAFIRSMLFFIFFEKII